jgi:hypothetical protein
VGTTEEIIGKDRCPTPVAAMASVWLALLIGAGVNAGWLFHALMRADVQFRGSGASSIDAAETGRILAGVLAQPAFVAVFVFGLLAGPLCAWLLLKQAQGLSRMAGHLRISAAALVLAGLAGAGQLLLARSIATRAEARTEALVSADISRATEARSELDRLHRWSERIYAGQSILVALGMTIMLKPAARREVASSG